MKRGKGETQSPSPARWQPMLWPSAIAGATQAAVHMG